MAETLLLLTFCLLLAAAQIVAHEREARQAAERRLEATRSDLEETRSRLEAELSRSERLSARLASEMGRHSEIPEDEIRKLMAAKEAVDSLEEAGLRTEDVPLVANAAARLDKLGITDPERVSRMAAVDETVRDHGLEGGGTAALDRALSKAEEAGDGNSKPHEWPPIISMSELDGYNFKSGSAELSADFKKRLADKASEISGIAERYGVDIVEVIGHTDEQPITRQKSNLDSELPDVIEGKASVDALVPADNAGLGLARALAVTEFLKDRPELKDLTLLPMSGAQLIMPGDTVTDGKHTGDVKARRRIEIRVRQRNADSASG